MQYVSFVHGSHRRSTGNPFLPRRIPTHSPHPKRHYAAYTLMELTVTTAIAGLLLAVAVPSLSDFVMDNRLITHVNTLVGDFYLVRSESIKRNEPVTICKSADGESCTTSSGWEQGWIVFSDRDADRVVGIDESILRIQQPFLNGITLTFRAFGSKNYMTYLPTGITNRNGTLTFCDRRGAAKARAIILYKTGRARTSRKKADGNPLVCP